MSSTQQFRHRLATRFWHWVNAVTVIILLMSGLTISNAHPRLYWGHFGAWGDPAWLILPRFPGWATIPTNYNLALARNWHLAFAWILAFGLLFYFLVSLINRHFCTNLALSTAEVRPSHLFADIKKHLRLDFSVEGVRYNPLQKISYLLVLCLLLPGIIFTGLAMSPGMDAGWPLFVDVFGGRQSARSLHFLCAFALAFFTLIHVILVILAGPINHIRAMITGNLLVWEVP